MIRLNKLNINIKHVVFVCMSVSYILVNLFNQEVTMKPIIGITSRNEIVDGTARNMINYTYIRAVEKSGALPVVIPNLKDTVDAGDMLKRIDGIIFTGGEDLSPLLYGEEPIKDTVDISYKRDSFEMALFKGAYKKQIPILGICRGLQLINVSLGGTLYQDIPSQIKGAHGHRSSYDIEGGYHSIYTYKDTILFDIFGEEKLVVNSQHHQSIRELGLGLKVNAKSPDGVIEGIESTTLENFVMGVQFHPEAMAWRDEKFLDIFFYFTKRCIK